MDKVARVFDAWAGSGRADLMEKEHGKNVVRFLDGIRLRDPFSFLDVGCGNGWVVRMMARKKGCRSSTGIDKSRNMIRHAEKARETAKEAYVHTDVESWKTGRRFDYVFAMESLYYAGSVETALAKIFGLLKPGGEFFCGTDFYADNRATSNWPSKTGLRMHLYSKKEWKGLLRDAGFRASARQVKDRQSKKRWKREFGTLFITGRKPGGQYSNPARQ